MPAVERNGLLEDALAWYPQGTDRYGQHTFSTEPLEIKVKWNPTTKIQPPMRGGSGRGGGRPSSDAEGFDAEVALDRDVPLMSLLFLGTADDYAAAVASNDLSGLHQLTSVKHAKDIKARNVRYTGHLVRYKGELEPLEG